jgi:hypothetical protein
MDIHYFNVSFIFSQQKRNCPQKLICRQSVGERVYLLTEINIMQNDFYFYSLNKKIPSPSFDFKGISAHAYNVSDFNFLVHQN